jgi:integrase
MLGRESRISDLTDDHVAGLLNWLQMTRGQQPATANGSHKCLTSLWRWLHNRGLLRTGPTVKPLRTPERVPRAWRREEIDALVAAVRMSPGSICGIPARDWWMILFAIEWDTGCRATELLSLRWEWLDWSTGWITVPAESRKGRRRDAAYGLLPDTLAFLAKFRQPQGLILRWDKDRSRYWQLWDALLVAAGLPKGRRSKTQALRRTFATWLLIGGGDATAACGHVDARTTARHYVDPSLTARRHGDSMPFRLLGLSEAG